MPYQNRISFHFDMLYIINMGEMCQRKDMALYIPM